MLKRKMYESLIRWKSGKDKKCLALRGARQVGKTFTVEQFARENYRHRIVLDFEKHPSYKSIFEGDLDTDTITMNIQTLVPGAMLVPGETLLFFDEIQCCPRACAALNSFKVYMRDTGLLFAMLGDGSRGDFANGVFGTYKGAVHENVVADVFGKAGKKLYYFEQKGKLEVDFFIRKNKSLIAIEVKSADDGKPKSMSELIDKFGIKQGIALTHKNVYAGESYYKLPLYMVMFL